MLMALEFAGEWLGELLAIGLLAALGDSAVGLWRSRRSQVVRGGIASVLVVILVGVLFLGQVWVVRAFE